ncbi:MAG TPA: DUF3332 domain-containing protein [Candidatus Cloacimonadota bacterium]|nr:DUF3332 domain-containing protein [Candidatus Cloacimonadota bacterium]HPT71546.1 DUF3332 domain-containing protein [Candidatus Cloacimonadota bacterium]
MKRKFKLFPIIIALIAVSFLFTACMGNFTLTKGLYKWNEKATDNKYINNVIFWILGFLPVYEAAVFIDVVVLNTIEFWTGKNPMAMTDGEKEIKVVQSGDKKYQITATKNRFDIVELKGKDAGQSVALVYSPESQTWSLDNGTSNVTIAQMNGNQMKLIYPDGKVLKIDMPR